MTGDNANNLGQVLNAFNNLTQAVNSVGGAIKVVFPQGTTITSTSGAASGKYLSVTGDDGVSYKIALLLP